MFEERSSWTSRKELLDGSTNSAYAGGGPEPPARSTVTASQTRAPSTSTGTAAALAAPAVPALIQPLRVAASRSWAVPARANTAATVGGGPRDAVGDHVAGEIGLRSPTWATLGRRGLAALGEAVVSAVGEVLLRCCRQLHDNPGAVSRRDPPTPLPSRAPIAASPGP